jgi:deoxyribonuclease V
LPALTECYNKLQEQPDVLFLEGHGIAHPRRCGIATHFGIVIKKPTIGVAKNILAGEVREGKIYLNNKLVGIELQTREGSRPIYISPGNMISLKTASELTKKFIIKPHKLPEPLAQVRKFTNRIKSEVKPQ